MLGSLKGLTFIEVLKVMQLLKKSGWLTVKLNDNSQYVIAFKEGVLVGLSTQAGEEIDSLEQITEIIYNFSYDWQGEYQFDPKPPHEIKVTVNCEVTDLVAQLQEVKKEWLEIKKVIPSFFAGLKLSETIKKDTLISPASWAILMALFSLGAEASPQQLQAKLGLTALTVCRQLMQLTQDGLIEVLKPSDSTTPAPAVKSGRYFKKSALETEVVIPAEWASYYERLEKNKQLPKKMALKTG